MDKSIFSVHFIVLDMEEDREIPLILGRPFLATGRALIDVHSGNLTLRVNDEKAKFSIYHTMKFLNEAQSCNRIDMIGDCVKRVVHGVLSSDPLEHCLMHSSFWKEKLPATKAGDACYNVDEDYVDYVPALESLLCEKYFGGQMDVIKLVSILEDNKNQVVLKKGVDTIPLMQPY